MRVRTVLIVEDDTDSREALHLVLAEEGYHVCVAEDGAAAVEALERAPHIGLVLLDARMPHMDGGQFLDWLDGQPQLAPVRVLVLSADSILAGHPRAAARLRKPYELEALLRLVDELCPEAG